MPSPELHTYCFYVDGMRMLDPSNVYMIRDIATYTNYFLVDGELSQNYFVYEVPRGTVSKVWYPSPTLGMERRRMTVYTPAGYEDSNKQYPVLYSKVWYPSPTLGMERRRMTVYTPAGYEDSNKQYPVLYLLHGAGGEVMKTAINNIRYYTCCMVREVMKMLGVSWVEPFRYLTT